MLGFMSPATGDQYHSSFPIFPHKMHDPGTPPSYTPARMDRRSVLKALGMLASAAALEGSAAKHVASAATPPPAPAAEATLLKLPKVNVQPDREIRTVVGLRPSAETPRVGRKFGARPPGTHSAIYRRPNRVRCSGMRP